MCGERGSKMSEKPANDAIRLQDEVDYDAPDIWVPPGWREVGWRYVEQNGYQSAVARIADMKAWEYANYHCPFCPDPTICSGAPIVKIYEDHECD